MVIPTARVAVVAQPTFGRGSERKTSGGWGSDGRTRELARQSLDLGFGSHMHATFPRIYGIRRLVSNRLFVASLPFLIPSMYEVGTFER